MKAKAEETLRYKLSYEFERGCIFSLNKKLYKYVDKTVDVVSINYQKVVIVALEISAKGGYVAIDLEANGDKKTCISPAYMLLK